jgi:hypothetical protein
MRFESPAPFSALQAISHLQSVGEDRHFIRLSNGHQNIWFDHERQAHAFLRAMLDRRVDSYHRRLPVWIPDEAIEDGIWCYADVDSITGSPGITQNYTFKASWSVNNLVEAIAGGGGGGGGDFNTIQPGGGAGGGGYGQYLNLKGFAPLSTTNLIVAAGGLGTSDQGGNGSNGGNSTFGAGSLQVGGGNGALGPNGAAGGNLIAGTKGFKGGSGTGSSGLSEGVGGGGAGSTGNGSGQSAGPGAMQSGLGAGNGGGGDSSGSAYGGGGGGGPASIGVASGSGAQGAVSVAWSPIQLSAMTITGCN